MSTEHLSLPPLGQSPPLELADEPIAAAPPDSAAQIQPTPPVRHIDYLGRHLVLVGLTPVGSLGIAVGATTVVLNLADSSIHLAAISIIWGVAAVIAVLAIVAGLREAAVYAGRSNLPADVTPDQPEGPAGDPPAPGSWRTSPLHKPTLQPGNPVDEFLR